MQNNKELGFILKRFLPQKHKLSVLCQNMGKIDLIINPSQRCNQFWPGMLISFSCCHSIKKAFIAHNTEILMSPHEIEIFSLKHLHHILELCFYFCPQQSPAFEVFNYLYNYFLIFRFEKQFLNQFRSIKKIFLLKLIHLLGFYPDKELIQYLNLYEQLISICQTSIDFNDQQKVESLKQDLDRITKLQIRKIDRWVLSCISNHPYINSFKTV